MKVLFTIKRICNSYKQDLLFSRKLANLRFVSTIKSYLRIKNTREDIDDIIIKYLEEKNGILELALTDREENIRMFETDKLPIWVCWWQDLENAPQIVKQCVKSIQNGANGHPVIVINKDNYNEWLDVPQNIISLVNNKKMCIAIFSDYLRFSLLNKYGGVWIDATIYIPQAIPEWIFECNLFTGKSNGSSCISNGRWTTFFFAGVPGNKLFAFMKNAIELYWENNESSIDYLMTDYLLDIAYRNIPECKNEIDSIPITNLHRNDLANAMVNGLPASEFKSILNDDTFFYKLSWREKYAEKTSEGEDTVYKYFCDMEL